MTERTFEQVAEVEAILDAIRPHLHVGSEEEAGVLAGHVLIAKHPQLAREFGDALRRRVFDQIWIERTRLALGLDENDEEDQEDGRITVEAGGKSIKLPRYIVNPGETTSSTASISIQRSKGTPSPPACRMDDPRGQHRRRPRPTGPQCRTAARAGGNEDAEIGDFLLRTEWHSMH